MRQTEIGPLPEDWTVVELGDISTFITSGPRGWSDRFREVGAPFVRITNMRREMIALNLAKMIYVHYDPDDAEAIRTSLRYGDLLISITADIGIISVVDERLRLPAFINQHIALVRVDESKGSPPYIARYLAGPSGEKYFRSITDTGAKPGLSLIAVRRVIFAAPPREEQNAIAEALGDVDTLLLGLDQLIEKKRAVKQAVMEQLLTGRRRLPGFSEAWRAVALGDALTLHHGESLLARYSESGAHPVVGSGGIIGYSNHFNHRGPSILIGRKGTIDRPKLMTTPFWAIDTVFVSDIVESVANLYFLHQSLCLIPWHLYSEATGLPSLNSRTISQITLHLPPSPNNRPSPRC